MGKDKDKDKVSYQLKTPKGTKDCKIHLSMNLCETDMLPRGG